jgi:hypothetical protein
MPHLGKNFVNCRILVRTQLLLRNLDSAPGTGLHLSAVDAMFVMVLQ